MPTQRYDNGVFILSEPGKAITFIPANRSIGIHSTERHGSLGPHHHPCEYVGDPAWCDGSFSHGDYLLKRWEDAGRDNQIVWDELAGWFKSYFPDADRIGA